MSCWISFLSSRFSRRAVYETTHIEGDVFSVFVSPVLILIDSGPAQGSCRKSWHDLKACLSSSHQLSHR